MALAAGAKRSLPAAMSVALTKSPALTAAPSSLSAPAPGRVVIFTASRALAGLSLGSEKPKSAVVKV